MAQETIQGKVTATVATEEEATTATGTQARHTTKGKGTHTPTATTKMESRGKVRTDDT